MTESKTPPRGAYLAPLFLFVMATLIPELLIGSTPLSRIHTLLFQFPYYGSAALLIREAVIRLGLGRAGLVVLCLAFGVITEGLALQSVFNPHFLNLDISFGRVGDVNWLWTIYMVGYHALWSVSIPVTLAGIVFRDRQHDPWLGRIGIGGFMVLFPVMAVAFHAIFVKMSNFGAPTLPYAGAAVAVTSLIATGLYLQRGKSSSGAPPPRVYLPGVLTFLGGLTWLLLYGEIFRSQRVAPASVNLAAGLLLAAASSLLSRRVRRGAWSDRHNFSFVAGGLAANSLFGFVVVSSSTLDTCGQIAVVLLVGTGLTLLERRLRQNPGG